MAAVEATLAKAGGRAATYVGRVALERLRRQAMVAKATALVDRATFDAFVGSLTAAEGSAFLAYVESAQFEHLAMRTVVWQLAGHREEDLTEIRETVRLNLKARSTVPEDRLLTATDLVVHLLTVASESTIQAHGRLDSRHAVAVAADVSAAAARSNEILAGLSSLREFEQFSLRLRKQVQATRSKMRLTHIGRRAGVAYGDLHVDPAFQPSRGPQRSAPQVIEQEQRVVVLGDPGAGKSTFAAKLAYDLARDAVDGFPGRVPFLLVVREHVTATAGRTLVAMLEDVARAPYNVEPPPQAVEHLLLTGSAFVIVDGLDESGDAETRRRLAELIDGFAHRYPLTSVVVTSRVIGYDEAPLDAELFAQVEIDSFSDDQVVAYARKWFGLDAHGRADTADAFLLESTEIPDLRSNPLVLSLLCSVYTSKGYLPRRRTQVYESCAELLFERWDQSRGIAVPLRFASHLRPAIARLAWLMFTEAPGLQALTRGRISEFLVKYMLEERFDNWADAAAAAGEFLDFCAGRAWVLTEVGVRGDEPLYGFTHRTFLEYFTAVQLVRSSPDPLKVWGKLAARIEDSSWRVVSYMAVQLLDFSVDGGANALLSHLLADNFAESRRADYLVLGAELSGQIVLRTDVLTRLTEECVLRSCYVEAGRRFSYMWDEQVVDSVAALDRPLEALLDVDLPENASRIVTAIHAALTESGVARSDDSNSCGFLTELMTTPTWSSHGLVGSTLVALLKSEDHTVRGESMLGLGTPQLKRYGVAVLFNRPRFGRGGFPSHALQLLHGALGASPENRSHCVAMLTEIYEHLVREPWPWLRAPRDLPAELWAPSVEGEVVMGDLRMEMFLELKPTPRSAALLLLLVMLEHQDLHDEGWPAEARPFLALRKARLPGWGQKPAVKTLRSWGLHPEAEDLAVRWVNEPYESSTISDR